ncbi:hypothetical protein [Prauserella alba]|uniref:DUF222 domain-containing protein n=1 Tax=Prauserella alba TaxID=176898 RepID=A0ABN1VGW4_9PSEU|nr:hypothetical protein [Prauserella alba]MCP2180034.1 hypothetical protein [Prauserella alba]
MAAPLADPYVADLERENEALIEALREALSREAVVEGERDQLATYARSLEVDLAWSDHQQETLAQQLRTERQLHHRTHTHAARLTDLLGDTPPAVTDFLDERPQFITALKNCPAESLADYHRWQGHAEARRQLAERLARASR